jgi:predicted anti-sigma-YlaC factor YlaD
MTDPRHHFDEILISGYLDGELTQADDQRVRIHLEDCPTCRETADELTKFKEATMSSKFQTPRDLQWDEAPRSGASRLARNAGLVIGLAWLLAVIGYVIVELVGTEDVLGILLVGGFVLSAGLIIVSALLDRRDAYKTDRYRRVKK